ncbi:MAG: hypothetical protein IPN26_08250 [Bacteroidetes bacterium]|nr:hypothetical protein [Bacteroidota bacterium]
MKNKESLNIESIRREDERNAEYDFSPDGSDIPGVPVYKRTAGARPLQTSFNTLNSHLASNFCVTLNF